MQTTLRFSKQKPHNAENEALTAGMVKNKQITMLVQQDKVFRFMKNIHGTPAYYQRTIRYDTTIGYTYLVCDIVTSRSHMIQIIGCQYGKNLTAEMMKRNLCGSEPIL